MACSTDGYVSEHNKAECLSMLLQFGANPNARDKHKQTALILASSYGFLELVNLLLGTENIDINAQDKEGWTVSFLRVNYRGLSA